MANKKQYRQSNFAGSALILTVVLTSMLAIVGVLFLMVSRLDKIATSAVSENKELNLAVETVIAKISQKLISDVPDANEEYYDYPDVNNAWLACLEPYQDGTYYKWRQISDVYRRLDVNALDLQAEILDDYQPNIVEDANADSDGDGVADSKWVIIPDITSSKGKPIYAAVRIIDNGGMLNANTAFLFDPYDNDPCKIDGSSQTQINLAALSQRGDNGMPATAADKLQLWRCGNMSTDIDLYKDKVIWWYGNPNGKYTPFDISDELELSYRFLLNHPDIDTRIETVWDNVFQVGKEVPYDSYISDWFERAQYDPAEPNKYSYRHLATTYNMDRIINPQGLKMVNVNNVNGAVQDEIKSLYFAILAGFFDAGFAGYDAIEKAAQTAVNLIDFRDSDNEVTVLDYGGGYYGFEVQPFISEIAFMISTSDPNNESLYVLELYNPFDVDISLDDFKLALRPLGKQIDLSGKVISADDRFVITNTFGASEVFGVYDLIIGGKGKIDNNLKLADYRYIPGEGAGTYEVRRSNIELTMNIGGKNICLDRQVTVNEWFSWNPSIDMYGYYSRPDNNWNIVYQEMVQDFNNIGSLGGPNGGGSKKNYNLAHSMESFVTVGDIARVLTIGHNTEPEDTIGAQLNSAEPSEDAVRLNLRSAAFQQLFNYLTVFDPAEYSGNDPNETRVKGRININTAPWFVLAQLPWMQPAIAQTIVLHRDVTAGGFRSIGELMNVAEMGFHAYNTDPLPGFPDLTPDDNIGDDFEERDVIFSRISNLVTVRSDVFTAYILVRIGENGPQKRVMAILDRSDVYPGPGVGTSGKVKIRALYPVPDPR